MLAVLQIKIPVVCTTGILKCSKMLEQTRHFIMPLVYCVFLSVVEPETSERYENVRWTFLVQERAGALAFESRRHNETDVRRFTNTDKKLIYKIMSKKPVVGGFRSGAGGLPSVFPNGSRPVNATGCPCSPGALKQQSPIK